MSVILNSKHFFMVQRPSRLNNLIVFGILLLSMVVINGFAQAPRIGNSSGTVITNWLNFEPGEEYTLEGSGTFMSNVSAVKYYPTVADFFSFFDKSSNSLGARVSWDRVGNHYVDIVPKVTQDRIDLYPVEDVVKVSLWVWSPGYQHDLAMIFNRIDGYVYSLHLTKLDFKGWRRVEVNLPILLKSKVNSVDVSQKYFFNRFRVYTQPYEKVGDIYVFLDRLDATREMFTHIYDGIRVENAIRKEKIDEDLKKQSEEKSN